MGNNNKYSDVALHNSTFLDLTTTIWFQSVKPLLQASYNDIAENIGCDHITGKATKSNDAQVQGAPAVKRGTFMEKVQGRINAAHE